MAKPTSKTKTSKSAASAPTETATVAAKATRNRGQVLVGKTLTELHELGITDEKVPVSVKFLTTFLAAKNKDSIRESLIG